MNVEMQETRRETIGAAVTPGEKWAVELVKRKTGKSVSDLLREHSLSELIEWGQRLDDALSNLDPAA